MWVQSLGQEDPLEKGMATHSSILAWRIPWTEEPGGLQSMGLQSRTWLSTNTCTLLEKLLGQLIIIKSLCKNYHHIIQSYQSLYKVSNSRNPICGWRNRGWKHTICLKCNHWLNVGLEFQSHVVWFHTTWPSWEGPPKFTKSCFTPIVK